MYTAPDTMTPLAIWVASMPCALSEAGVNVTETTVEVRTKAKISASMPPCPSPAIRAPSAWRLPRIVRPARKLR